MENQLSKCIFSFKGFYLEIFRLSHIEFKRWLSIFSGNVFLTVRLRIAQPCPELNLSPHQPEKYPPLCLRRAVSSPPFLVPQKTDPPHFWRRMKPCIRATGWVSTNVNISRWKFWIKMSLNFPTKLKHGGMEENSFSEVKWWTRYC